MADEIKPNIPQPTPEKNVPKPSSEKLNFSGGAPVTPSVPQKPTKQNLLSKSTLVAWFKEFASPQKHKPQGIMATDLIKGEVVTFFNWQKNLTIFALLLFLDYLVIIIGYQTVLAWGNSKQIKIDEAEQKFLELKIERSRNEVNLNAINALQTKVAAASAMLNRHIYWTNFFPFIEENTLSNVSFSGFSGDVSGKYTLAATTDSYYSMIKQLEHLRKNPNVISAKATGYGYSGTGADKTVSFGLELVINSNIFLKPKKDDQQQ
ncbi:MAG: hypothetical protein WCK11_05655 [Candidatus Falkowbacteria bacterium]